MSLLKQSQPSNSTSEETKEFALIEPSYQTVKILEISDEVEAKNGNGSYVEMKFEITNGDYERRKLWHKFFISHKNKKVVNIGRLQLDQLLIASGVPGGIEDMSSISDLKDLVDSELRVKVNISEGSNGFKPQNKITAFYENKKGFRKAA